MLCEELNATFVLGIILTYGLSIGFSGSYFRVVRFLLEGYPESPTFGCSVGYGVLLHTLANETRLGCLNRCVPNSRVHTTPLFHCCWNHWRRFCSDGCIYCNFTCCFGFILMVGITAGMAIGDVTIDACIARNSIEIRALAPDMQSLCGFCSSVGSLIGYSASGFLVRRVGAQVLDKVGGAMEDMISPIRCPQVWKPSLYMFLSLALNISTHERQFYWYTNPEAGPAFSQEFVGMIYAAGALASIAGVLIYHKFLKKSSFRNLLFYAQLFFGIAGITDIFFVLRWNLKLGLPDYFFVMFETCVSQVELDGLI